MCVTKCPKVDGGWGVGGFRRKTVAAIIAYPTVEGELVKIKALFLLFLSQIEAFFVMVISAMLY